MTGAKSGASSIEARTEIVREAGFKFTYDELTQVANQVQKSGELNDERLKMAVGGVTMYTTLGLTSPTGFNATAFSSLFGTINRTPGAVAGISVFE